MPESNRLRRTKSGEGRRSPVMSSYGEPGTSTISPDTTVAVANPDPMPDEGSSFLTKSSSSDGSEEYRVDAEINRGQVIGNSDIHHGHHIDIRGWALTRRGEFWLLFFVLGLLTGTGLMTIKYASAPSKPLQQLQVSNVFCSNIGHSVCRIFQSFPNLRLINL